MKKHYALYYKESFIDIYDDLIIMQNFVLNKIEVLMAHAYENTINDIKSINKIDFYDVVFPKLKYLVNNNNDNDFWEIIKKYGYYYKEITNKHLFHHPNL